LERGRGRIVITGSGAAYLPHSGSTAYPASKAAVWRFGNVLAEQLAGRIPVFVISPGLVKTEMTKRAPDDAPWTPPELAPHLVRTGSLQRLRRLRRRRDQDHLSQALPAELRSLRRGSLLRPRQRPGPARARRHAACPNDLRGHVAARPAGDRAGACRSAAPRQ